MALHLNRRSFLGGALAASVAPLALRGQSPRPASFTVEETSLADLLAGLDSGRWTSKELVTKYLARIGTLDQAGPTLRSVVEINPDALPLAEAADEARARKGKLGLLHGIPVLLKENIDTADRMKTTAGSRFLLDAPAPSRDAFLVQKLREAGAIILGKTNLSEWANFRSSKSSSGWSARGGQTRNPYALDRNTSGSSSGSAVAVAASLCAAAVGTETDGSIVSPSSICGIVGLKPTLGLISRSGIVPIAHSQDTAGPMARSVRDAAILLSALVGVDPRDRATAESPAGSQRDYVTFLDAKGLQGRRLGVLKNLVGAHPHVEKVMRRQLEVLKTAGATLVEVELPTAPFEAAEFEVLLYEFKADLEAYLASRGLKQGLADIIAFNKAHGDLEMPFFGQDLMEQAAAKGPLTEDAYLKALETCRRQVREEGIHKVLASHKLDALVAPTGSPAWLTDHVNGDAPGFSCSSIAAVAGTPHITVPMGLVFGLPVGLSFMGRAWSEPTLLAMAYAFEQSQRARSAPKYLPTVAI